MASTTAFQVYTPINAHTFLALQTVKAHGVIAVKSLALIQATFTHVQLCMTRVLLVIDCYAWYVSVFFPA